MSSLAMLDHNITRLPGAKQLQGWLFAAAATDGLLIVGESGALAMALAQLWKGAALTSQLPAIAIFLGCVILRQALGYARDARTAAFASKTAGELREHLANALGTEGPAAITSTGTGAIAATMITGVEQVRVYLELSLPRVTALIATTAVLAAALLATDAISGIIAIVIIPVTIFFMRLLGGVAKERATAQLGTYQRMANHFLDTLRGITTIKAFGRGKAETDGVFATSEDFRTATVDTLKTATLSSLVLDLFCVFGVAAIAIMLGFRLMAGDISLFRALMVLIITPELFAVLQRFARNFHANLNGQTQLAAIFTMLDDVPNTDADGQRPDEPVDKTADQDSRVKCSSHPAPSPGDIAMDTRATCSGQLAGPATDRVKCSSYPAESQQHAAAPAVSLSQVSFAYPDAADHRALAGITFSTSGAERVGIVGASGAGKSSLTALLAGFIPPESGAIGIDGVPASTLATTAWHSRVAYIPQHPHIFHASLRDNLAFYQPEARDQDILAAAERAGLAGLIAGMPDGLDTIIGQGARGLSGGQEQRVALTRVLLCASRDVLVFDEPTAHLDIETELALKPAMREAMEGRLVFFATHRLHWMADMDTILVLDRGRIVQQGTPADLASQDGPYRRLREQGRATIRAVG